MFDQGLASLLQLSGSKIYKHFYPVSLNNLTGIATRILFLIQLSICMKTKVFYGSHKVKVNVNCIIMLNQNKLWLCCYFYYKMLCNSMQHKFIHILFFTQG